MESKHDRKFVTGSVSLVLGRIRNQELSLQSRDFLDNIVKKIGFFDGAPFLWVNVTRFYGIKNDLKVKFGRINKKYGDLPVTVELDMEILQWADRNNLDLFRDVFMIAGLEILIQVGKKYKLPTQAFEAERAKYGNIPDTLEACASYVSPVSGELTPDV